MAEFEIVSKQGFTSSLKVVRITGSKSKDTLFQMNLSEDVGADIEIVVTDLQLVTLIRGLVAYAHTEGLNI